MGLPWTAWLQAAVWVLREAGGGGARCLWLLEKPKMAQIEHTWGRRPASGAALPSPWELAFSRFSSVPLQGPSQAQAGGGNSGEGQRPQGIFSV